MAKSIHNHKVCHSLVLQELSWRFLPLKTCDGIRNFTGAGVLCNQPPDRKTRSYEVTISTGTIPGFLLEPPGELCLKGRPSSENEEENFTKGMYLPFQWSVIGQVRCYLIKR